MAGQPSGLSAHTPSVSASAASQAKQQQPNLDALCDAWSDWCRTRHLQGTASTRTRRNHGAFNVGGQLACVYSTRRAGKCYGVSFELGAGTLLLASSMTPTQARQMARALSAAADAAELVQGGAA